MLYRHRTLIAFFLVFCFLPNASAQTLGYWPTSGWRTATPESQGIDSEVLATAINTARQQGTNIHSLLVVRNNYLVAEVYFYPYDGKVPHDLASVTKSITATLIGLAIEQRKVKSVEQKALSFFSKNKIANKDGRKEKITIEHLLTMSSGLNCISKGGEPTLWEMLNQTDNVQYMLDLPMVAEPGSNFVYCSGGMHLLSAIISNAMGMRAEAVAQKFLFEPIGIKQAIWPFDPQGINHGFGNLHLLPRDMAKLGVLMMNQGKWDNRALVPTEWVQNMTRSHIKTGNPRDYGYGWWVYPAGNLIPFEASGRGGQQISVIPSKNAVIVLNGGGFNAGEFMKLVLPAIKSDQPLPANPAAEAKLKVAIVEVARANTPAPIPALPALAKTISGKTFTLAPNWIGLQSLTLNFPAAGDPTIRLAFIENANMNRTEKVREVRPIGLDGVLRLSPNGRYGLSVGLRGNWEDAQTFVLEYDEVANLNHYRLRLTFTDTSVKVQAKERTGLFDETFEGKVEAGSK
ncbi:MAG TPA: serine hydrolase [Blastocatellia bacterium]|nr:serine hydrolase [Blastocatellia bacterium]